MNMLFKEPLSVLNVGLSSFADNIIASGGEAKSLSWLPPAQGNKETGAFLAKVINHPKIEQANQQALHKCLSVNPVLFDIQLAKEAIPALREKRILHSGPPIAWEDMCGPMQGAILGAILYEKWAENLTAAEELILQGVVNLSPCHHYNAVGPMAGVISPSMPVWVVGDQHNSELKAFCNFNEGLGKVLRFGANHPDVLSRLYWMKEELFPILKQAVKIQGGVELKPIIARALHMGDEVHNRNAAASALFLKILLSALLSTDYSLSRIKSVIEFISNNDHFFLNLSMAACKVMLKAAENIPYSTMVTTMARNGVNFGIRISSMPEYWFQAPANQINGLYFPDYNEEDAAADLGDSAITETAGIGGFAMAAAPAIVQFVGGTPSDAIRNSLIMKSITIGENPAFTLPAINFAPTAMGIDIRKVLDTNILPIINTGIAHKVAGIGQIGAGITTAPIACFDSALHTFIQQYPEFSYDGGEYE